MSEIVDLLAKLQQSVNAAHANRARWMSEPTRDQSYCDVGRHEPMCSGYTEDEADPESCMCPCHEDDDA